MDKIISNFKDVVLNKYVKFDGKADRGEFWRFFLAVVLSGVVVYLLLALFAQVRCLPTIINVIYLLVSLGLLLPNLAVTVRRLRDIGKDWPWIFIALIPFIGAIWLLVLLAKPSQSGQDAAPTQ